MLYWIMAGALGNIKNMPRVVRLGAQRDFAKDLLNKKKVALVPGVAFGKSCEGYVRISYTSSYENWMLNAADATTARIERERHGAAEMARAKETA